jgi:uncharacterized protein with ParB-like and HNH nuclease domain
MQEIIGRTRSLSDLLQNKRYGIQYYQREYRWGKKQLEDLIDDLTEEFNDSYNSKHPRSEVEKYGHYYLGAIVLSGGDNKNAIIDGQQRLTSLTLLLIYLNNLQKGRQNEEDKVPIDTLIRTQKFGRASFNIDVEERNACLEALYENKLYDFTPSKEPESIQAIFQRYNDIVEIFPESLKNEALPYFIEWLIYNVDLVEISTDTEQDGHKIFVTMNDRGLILTPTEMLKGFLLSEIKSDETRNKANDIWKKQIQEINELNENNKEEDADFFEDWLRSQYAESIRPGGPGTANEDWDIIGTTFHKWVRENTEEIGLNTPSDYERFVLEYLPKYAWVYKLIENYSTSFNPEFECVFYNANRNFTLQNQVILAAIDPTDDESAAKEKVQIVSRYLDQYIARRVFNFKTVDYSSIKTAIFNITKKIRRKPIPELRTTLIDDLSSAEFTLDGIDAFYLNQFTGRYMRHILARMTYYLEQNCGRPTRFEDLVDRKRRNPYDVEHILPDRYDLFQDTFQTDEEFQRVRNRFGDLLVLPQDLNRSFQDADYQSKLMMYYGDQNLLAKSLHEACYKNNPQFLRFIEEKKLPFRPLNSFSSGQIDERQRLYKSICREIWNVTLLAEYEVN